MILSLCVFAALAGDPALDPTTEALATEAAAIPGASRGAPPADIEAVTQAITTRLRCPVCQGLSVADSTAPAAVMMQKRARELVALGYHPSDIEDYFVSKYGEFILLDPRSHGLNQLSWIGPLLAAGVGLLVASTFLKGRQASPPPLPPAPVPDDPYARALLKEVDDE